MAYLRTWGDIQAWMQDNGIIRWNISRTQDKQDNNNVFVYDKDKSAEENKLICERALDRFAGDVLYLVGWRTGEARTGGFSATILYDRAGQQNAQSAPAPQIGGLYGMGGSVDIGSLTADIEQRIANRYEKERLERLEKDLREEKRDLEARQSSALGLLAQYLAPVAQQLIGKVAPMPKVAGIDADQPVHAQTIEPHKEQAQSGQDEPEEVEVFCTEEEYNRAMALLERFAKVEPQWLDLLEKVAVLAESGDGTYTMAKQFLLK